MKHLPLRECGYAIAVLVVLLGLFAGAYLGMMERRQFAGDVSSWVDYRFVGKWSREFFRPAHEIDCWLQPKLWEFEIDPLPETVEFGDFFEVTD